MGILFNPEVFYSRQIVLPELGPQGQRKLEHARVAVVGVGGLGSVSALYLALAGVGFLRLIDQDTVEPHNLHRQILYSMNDVRYPKVEVAAKRIKSINPWVDVDPVPESLRKSNVEDLIKDVDCVVDGLDNIGTRYLLNIACIKRRIPYVFGAAIGIEGIISVFMPPETPCLECAFPGLSDENLPSCDTRGVLGSTTGVIGTLQALETFKLLTGVGELLKGKLLFCDLKSMDFVKLDVFKQPGCPACQENSTGLSREEQLVWLCGQKTVNVNPPHPMFLELGEIHERLRNRFKVLLRSSIVIVFNYHDNFEISLFRNGRMLIKNVEDEDDALNVYRNVLNDIGINNQFAKT
ncbi:MAG: HesA/MoeB/ThiF family protein [Thermoproteota archaeon]